LVNSRSDRFTAAIPKALDRCRAPPSWRPFSRSYGTILPSSFTRVLSLTLGFSPRPPVAVCGTGSARLPRGFSSQCRIGLLGLSRSPSPPLQRVTITLRVSDRLRLTSGPPWTLAADFQSHGRPTFLRPPIGSNVWSLAPEYRPAVHRLRLSPSA
jgi:hypothetical protein